MNMTSKQRVLNALRRVKPDRVPIFNSFTPQIEGQLCHYFRCSSDDLDEVIGNDVKRVSFSPPLGFHNINYSDGSFTDEWGIGYKRVGYYDEMIFHPLADLNKIDQYQFPDPWAPGRFDQAKKILQKNHLQLATMGFLGSTNFEPSWYLVGLEKFLIEFFQENPIIEYILDQTLHFYQAIGQQMISLGVDIIMCGDDVGTQQGMMISPQVWRKRLKPRLDQLFRTFKQSNPNIIIVYHSDGNIEPIIPDLIELGLDVLNPIQPKCMDPIEIKRKYGDHLAFFGTIDEQETLPFLNEEEVRNEVKTRIQTVGYNGGLLLGATHNIQPDTPLKNIMVMYDEVQSNLFLQQMTS